ncbi:MAG: Uma2 family endonuclease [Planctomycetota bacterium]
MEQPVPTNKRYTWEEYLAFEESSPVKHEFHDGKLVPIQWIGDGPAPEGMAGGTENHSSISIGVSSTLRTALRGKPCKVHGSELKLQVPAALRGYYPDAMIICGDTEYPPDDKHRTSVLNPRVIVEVLSDSTSDFDLGEKFDHYRLVESLQEYVVISQTEPRIRVFRRNDDGTWTFDVAVGLDATARLDSVEVDLPLAEVYADVEFDKSDAKA